MKKTIALVTRIRREDYTILEFVKYYERLGVNKIILINNNMSSDNQHPDLILKDEINSGLVTIIDCTNSNIPPDKLYIPELANYVNNSKDIYDYYMLFDADEYLDLNKSFNTIGDYIEYLESKNGNNVIDEICLNWTITINCDIIFKEPKHKFFETYNKYCTKEIGCGKKIISDRFLKKYPNKVFIHYVFRKKDEDILQKDGNGNDIKPFTSIDLLPDNFTKTVKLKHMNITSVENFIERRAAYYSAFKYPDYIKISKLISNKRFNLDKQNLVDICNYFCNKYNVNFNNINDTDLKPRIVNFK